MSPDNYDQERCCNMEADVWLQKLQRVFKMSEFGLRRDSSNTFVLLEHVSGKNENLWVAKVLLLLYMHIKARVEEKEFSFVQYMDVNLSCDNVDSTLRFVSLRWRTYRDIDCTFAPKDWSSGAEERKAGE